MPLIETAEDAATIAETFLGRYYVFRKLLKAKREDDAWLVEFDVGVFNRQVARIMLDAQTGKVTEYLSPDIQ